ncbi:MAG: dihydrofolate reductase [Bacteroidetes bacterium 46-16]|nr:MAG: dihydrofolate reductase [Bacteroidetes bacterium 46-16]
MRKVIFGINMTLDGCVDHTKGTADEDVHDYFTDLIRHAGVLVYGRITYQLMVPFWPDMARDHSAPTRSLNDFAVAFDSVDKVVFSRSLDKVDDRNTTIVRGDLKKEIVQMKQESGKNIMIGGVDLPAQLIELGLVDEYHFVVQPIIAGKGRRMDNINLQQNISLTLAESKALPSGCIALRYLSK